MSRNLFLLVTGMLVIGIITWWFGAQVETRLFALEIKTGRVERSAQPGSPADWFGPLTASSDRVLVGVMTPEPGYEKSWKLIAFETVSGQPVWEFHPDPAQFGRVEAEETIGQDLLVTADRVYAVIRVEDPQISDSLLTKVAVLEATTGVLQQVIGPVWFDQAYSHLPIAVAGNHLLVISPENPANLTLQALDLETGVPLWHTPLGYDADTFHPALFGPAIAANDQTVFLAMSRSIRAFDLATGSQKFTAGDVRDGTIHQIGLVGSNLYDCRSDHLTAFDAATGVEKWRYPRPFDQFSLCHFYAEAKSVYPAYFFEDLGQTEHGGGWVMALDAATGRERWRTRLFTAAYLFDAPTARQLPAITPDLVLAIGGAEGQPVLIALSKTDGREQWRFSGGREPVTDGSHVFVLDRRSPRWRRWLAW